MEALTVAGFKSICSEQTVEIRPLTILAGANSSGKSSMLQPLLLLKQTLEASYDPGPLLLNGPNVRFTEVDQLFPQVDEGGAITDLRIGVRVAGTDVVTTAFRKGDRHPIEVCQTSVIGRDVEDTIEIDKPFSKPLSAVPPPFAEALDEVSPGWREKAKWRIERERCFLTAVLEIEGAPPFAFSPGRRIRELVTGVIHLPGLRGNPERTYPVGAIARTFPGTFEKYVASVVAQWEDDGNDGKVERIGRDLSRLGLTWKVKVRRRTDTEVELSVGRLATAARGGAWDLVNIADVGFGVSQVLPVIVALHAAQPGQVVYVEQPELHLHPRAQGALAEILGRAAKRGVRVIAETHSASLLLAVQALVAEGKLSTRLVKLHWFERDPRGSTNISSADLDESGAFGDWPEDFAEVAMQTESRYLDAVESRHGKA